MVDVPLIVIFTRATREPARKNVVVLCPSPVETLHRRLISCVMPQGVLKRYGIFTAVNFRIVTFKL
jgi:hypothetical protein